MPAADCLKGGRTADIAMYQLHRDSNLGRIYRTIWTLCGQSTIHLIDCDAELTGNLYSATGRLTTVRYPDRECFMDAVGGRSIVAFEKGSYPVFDDRECLPDICLFGGESATLRPRDWPGAAFRSIRTVNPLCLLCEVAVAVVLYGRRE